MDPDEALDRLREAAAVAGRCVDDMAVHQMIAAFNALDDWLSNGGFPPKDWANGVGPVLRWT